MSLPSPQIMHLVRHLIHVWVGCLDGEKSLRATLCPSFYLCPSSYLSPFTCAVPLHPSRNPYLLASEFELWLRQVHKNNPAKTHKNKISSVHTRQPYSRRREVHDKCKLAENSNPLCMS